MAAIEVWIDGKLMLTMQPVLSDTLFVVAPAYQHRVEIKR